MSTIISGDHRSQFVKEFDSVMERFLCSKSKARSKLVKTTDKIKWVLRVPHDDFRCKRHSRRRFVMVKETANRKLFKASSPCRCYDVLQILPSARFSVGVDESYFYRINYYESYDSPELYRLIEKIGVKIFDGMQQNQSTVKVNFKHISYIPPHNTPAISIILYETLFLPVFSKLVKKHNLRFSVTEENPRYRECSKKILIRISNDAKESLFPPAIFCSLNYDLKWPWESFDFLGSDSDETDSAIGIVKVSACYQVPFYFTPLLRSGGDAQIRIPYPRSVIKTVAEYINSDGQNVVEIAPHSIKEIIELIQLAHYWRIDFLVQKAATILGEKIIAETNFNDWQDLHRLGTLYKCKQLERIYLCQQRSQFPDTLEALLI